MRCKGSKNFLITTLCYNFFIFLVDEVKTCVRAQNLRYADTLWSLVILEEGCYDTWQSQRRAIEGVSQLGLLVSILVAELEAVCLERLEVRNRRHLQPALLRLRVYLEVVGQSRSERHIATAKAQDTIWQAERLNQALNVSYHTIQSLEIGRAHV